MFAIIIIIIKLRGERNNQKCTIVTDKIIYNSSLFWTTVDALNSVRQDLSQLRTSLLKPR